MVKLRTGVKVLLIAVVVIVAIEGQLFWPYTRLRRVVCPNTSFREL